MNKLVWNDKIAQTVEAWVAQCVFKHDRNEYGQNLAASTGTDEQDNIQAAITSWYNEQVSYIYGQGCMTTGSCHYTQVVWANSKQVGCAAKFCASLDVMGNIWRNTWFFGCYYDPPGNFRGELPYERGTACSHCAPDQVCVDKLCADS